MVNKTATDLQLEALDETIEALESTNKNPERLQTLYLKRQGLQERQFKATTARIAKLPKARP